uniref:Uncharacterized protein n=1 Tax=Panagrolaimus sp. JU765 TaxID=591449 RepID=A0AC34QBF5_9BILA
MSRPRGGSASHARSYKITTPRRNPIQKRNPAPPNHIRKRVPIRNFRASTPEPSTSLVSPSPITARDGTVLSKEEIQDRLRKQADKLILRLEDNADKIEKDLPNNVLAYFAQMKDKEEDDVVEIIPTVTIQDEDRSVLPPVIEVEDGEIIDNQRAKTGFTVDDEVVFLEFKRKLDEDVVIIEDTRTIERSKVETMRFQRGMPSTKLKKPVKRLLTTAARIGW